MHQLHLITRPEPDASLLFYEAKEFGIECFINPLIEISYNTNLIRSFVSNNNFDNRVLIATSVNSLRAFAGLNCKFNLADLIVSSNRAYEIAKSLRFKNVYKFGTEAIDLINFFQVNPTSREIIYLSGNHITVDIVSSLRSLGYNASNLIVYNSSSRRFTEKTISLFRSNLFTSVSIFSLKTADTFVKEVIENNLYDEVSSVKLFTISRNIANFLSTHLNFKKSFICDTFHRNRMAHFINEGYRN